MTTCDSAVYGLGLDDRHPRSRRADDQHRLFQCAWQVIETANAHFAAEMRRHRLSMARSAVQQSHACPLGHKRLGGGAGHDAGPEHRDGLVGQPPRDRPLRDVYAGRRDRWALREACPTAYPPGRVGRTLEDTTQRGRDRRERFGLTQRVAQLATDLLLADDERIQSRGNPHQVQQRFGASEYGQIGLQLGHGEASRFGQAALQRAHCRRRAARHPGVDLDTIAGRNQHVRQFTRRACIPALRVKREALADLERREVVAYADHDQARHQIRSSEDSGETGFNPMSMR